MEEVINSIRRVCELAKNLETELPNLANQPAMLSLSIDEIVGTLSCTKERLLSLSSFSDEMLQQLHETQQPQMDTTLLMQEWLRSSCAMTIVDDDQLFKMQQQLQASRSTTRPFEARSKGSQGEVQAIEASHSRSRRRYDPSLSNKKKNYSPSEFHVYRARRFLMIKTIK